MHQECILEKKNVRHTSFVVFDIVVINPVLVNQILSILNYSNIPSNFDISGFHCNANHGFVRNQGMIIHSLQYQHRGPTASIPTDRQKPRRPHHHETVTGSDQEASWGGKITVIPKHSISKAKSFF